MEMKNPRTGIMMNCNDTGQGRAAIILIHGWTANLTRWSRVQKLLAPEFRVIDYDLRGHGLSQKGPELEYTLEACVEDLAGLMDALGIDEAILCGHSMGGMIAQKFTLAYPERVRKLILVATAAFIAENEKQRKSLCKAAWLFAHFFPLAIWIKDGKKKKQPDKFPDVLDPQQTCAPAAASKFLRQIAELDLRENVKELKKPVLILAAEVDETVPRARTEQTAAIIPGAEIRFYPDCGHHINLEQHEKVAAAIKEFVNKQI